MFKLTTLTLLLATGVSVAHSQTKLIAFKSHSGHMEHFNSVLTNPKSDLICHNLGAAPTRLVQTAAIDSLILISDTVAVMVTSDYCQRVEPEFFVSDSMINLTHPPRLWSKGRDTVVNHPLFSQRHELEQIKTVLKTKYYFKNDIDCTIFVGYDNNLNDSIKSNKEAREEPNQNGSTPVSHKNDPPSFFRISFLLTLLFIMGMVMHHKISQKRLS